MKVANGQTVIDIAIEGCGDASRLFDVAQANEIGITDDLVPGEDVTAPAATLDKQKFVSLFAIAINKPASGDSTMLMLPEGIGYWYIEKDFVAS